MTGCGPKRVGGVSRVARAPAGACAWAGWWRVAKSRSYEEIVRLVGPNWLGPRGAEILLGNWAPGSAEHRQAVEAAWALVPLEERHRDDGGDYYEVAEDMIGQIWDAVIPLLQARLRELYPSEYAGLPARRPRSFHFRLT